MCAAGAFGQFPIKVEKVVEIVIGPLRGLCCPNHLKPAGDGIAALAGAKAVLPAQALFFKGCAFWLWANMGIRVCCTMGFAECVAAGNQRHGFLIVHRHAGKSFPNIAC